MGLLSISNNKYDPPCKSNPRLILLSNNLQFVDKKFEKEKYDKKIIKVYIKITFSLEKYKTKYNYFFVAVLLNKLCIVY